MKAIKTTTIALAALVAGFAVEAQAGVITYDLLDRSGPNKTDGGFFQRGTIYNFDTAGADATLAYDEHAGTVSIFGQAFNTHTQELAGFEVNYSDVTADGNRLTLNDMGVVGEFDGIHVGGKGFNLTLGDTVRGDGWLVLAGTDQHFGDFHFTGTPNNPGNPGNPNGPTGQVPVPAPLTLIGAMALFFGLRRRRRAAAA